jgi:hypothetical protein
VALEKRLVATWNLTRGSFGKQLLSGVLLRTDPGKELTVIATHIPPDRSSQNALRAELARTVSAQSLFAGQVLETLGRDAWVRDQQIAQCLLLFFIGSFWLCLLC